MWYFINYFLRGDGIKIGEHGPDKLSRFAWNRKVAAYDQLGDKHHIPQNKTFPQSNAQRCCCDWEAADSEKNFPHRIQQIEEDYTFKIASLSGQFLIKLDTWQDRHLRTKKDATDMVFILQNIYVAYALSHDALPAEIDIDAEHFDVVVAGAEWIASDLKKILSDEHKAYYAQLLDSELSKNEDSPLLNDMLDVSDSRNYSLFRRAMARIAQILRQ